VSLDSPSWSQIPFVLTNLLPHASIRSLTLPISCRLRIYLPTRWVHPQFSPIDNPQLSFSSAFLPGNNLAPILQTYGQPDLTMYLDYTFRQPSPRTSPGLPFSSICLVPNSPTRHPHRILINILDNISDHYRLLTAYSGSPRPLQPPTQVRPTCSLNKIEVNSLSKNLSLAPGAPIFPPRLSYYLPFIPSTHSS
jgi:hypothetical protein